ncbi:hypothetical protein IGI04_005520 [Brassica rapa subsp. trilocularis]|uniref:FHA domain-containing protein n=1 Tax=Brassica rapa subsp. trilocularis TaxID=1813537 RepID=A0ABQ7NE85_BRACM|nr:hypothetical protein IGI04_005520 [Brassica rapa subsp. trilocularis]
MNRGRPEPGLVDPDPLSLTNNNNNNKKSDLRLPTISLFKSHLTPASGTDSASLRSSQMGTGTNGELKYEISQNAYIKLVLHSLRHKTAAVNGVLVGRISPNDEGVVEISDSLNNKKLEGLSKGKDRSPVMQLCVRDASKNWRVVGADGGSKLLLKEPSANVVLSDYISSEKWKEVIDFDDHLDDVTKDWLNPGLFN